MSNQLVVFVLSMVYNILPEFRGVNQEHVPWLDTTTFI